MGNTMKQKPYEGMRWRQLGSSMHGGEETEDPDFMGEVAISNEGNRVVLGSPWGFEGSAPIKVFDFDGGGWKEVECFVGRREVNYGRSIALSGDGKRLAIGSELSDCCKGEVEVHQYQEETGWRPMGDKLTGHEPNDQFGKLISLSENGSRMAIGAVSREDKSQKSRCSIRCYTYVEEILEEILLKYAGGEDWCSLVMEFLGSGWQQIGQTIVADEIHWSDGAVALSSDGCVIAVGYPECHTNSYTGAVRVFRYSPGQTTAHEQSMNNVIHPSKQKQGHWIPVGQTLHGVAHYNRFGLFISVNQNASVVAVGANRTHNYIQIFSFDGHQWNRKGRTIFIKYSFGSLSLSSNGDRIAVSSYSTDGSYGCVEVLDWGGEDWVMRKIHGRQGEKFFGSSVSLSTDGDRMAVGTYLERRACLKVYEFC